MARWQRTRTILGLIGLGLVVVLILDWRQLAHRQDMVAAATATAQPSPQPTTVRATPRPRPTSPPLPGMPETIVVGLTYTSDCTLPTRTIPTERVRFVDYVRNVLPNEWVASWPDVALDVGAIAVKQFAWHSIVVQRKWRSQGYPFDVIDNSCDQYYRDESANPRTDAAIQRTWGMVLIRNGMLLPLYYRDTDTSCESRDCLGQVESSILAGAGQSVLQILARYFNAPGTGVLMTGDRLPPRLPPVPRATHLAPPHLTRPPSRHRYGPQWLD